MVTLSYIIPHKPRKHNLLRISTTGLILSGGKETIIEARVPLGVTKQDAEYLMLGHSSNVCALDVYGDIIVSGSWDWYISMRGFLLYTFPNKET